MLLGITKVHLSEVISSFSVNSLNTVNSAESVALALTGAVLVSFVSQRQEMAEKTTPQCLCEHKLSNTDESGLTRLAPFRSERPSE